MPTPTRYDTDHLAEAQFEPNSRGRVLKNLLGIRLKREMDALEAVKLAEATDYAIRHISAEHRFTAQDVCTLHQQWLGKVYPWAGEYRQVNISKGGFTFAMSAQISRLMEKLEKTVLAAYTPCHFVEPEKVIEALAVTHCELVLIHPFRDGNGRLARLLATLMALQAGLPLLDFSGIRGKKREAYFAAVQSGMGRNYAPMEAIFRAVIAKTLRR
ncbi:MAG: Fic family protein [Gammaproteobacteria bacterium]|nr:Fic family protein [Gammaproteobacteria bacterium]MBU1978410.1 Fic family protein [Gammaproteobacteria bacterium]